MKRFLVLLLATLFVSGCNVHRRTTPLGMPGAGHASYAIGWKGKDSSWEGADDELVFGVLDFDARIERKPIWFAGKLLFGTAGEPDYVADPRADQAGTLEFDFGLRTYTVIGRFEPFLSGGLAILYGSISGDDDYSYYSRTLDDAATIGGWVDAGFHLPISSQWGVGLVVHYSHGAEQELEGEDVQLGGVSVLFTIGGRW